jgi:hypothetical protein
MVRANANSTSAPDVAHDLLWERVSEREQRRIEGSWLSYRNEQLDRLESQETLR